MTEQLQKLINLFLQKVYEAEEIMKKEFSIDRPIEWRQNNVSRNGTFGNFSYSFHGIGCCFNFGEVSVDYDYGDQGRIDGFDLWRLTIFGEQLKDIQSYVETGSLKTDFETSVKSGEIKKSGGQYDNLYYLSKSI